MSGFEFGLVFGFVSVSGLGSYLVFVWFVFDRIEFVIYRNIDFTDTKGIWNIRYIGRHIFLLI